MIPCENCITLAMCKNKSAIFCVLVDDWVFLHDHDPGHRGAQARADHIKEFFGFTRVILNRTDLVVFIDDGGKNG